jgi:hypothetical protein
MTLDQTTRIGLADAQAMTVVIPSLPDAREAEQAEALLSWP